MMRILGGKLKTAVTSRVLAAFVQSLDMHGADEVSICSSVLDIMRAYLGDRPCCVWKNEKQRLEKLCERGMVDLFLDQEREAHQNAMARALVSGASEFDPCRFRSLTEDIRSGFDGFLHMPIKAQGDVVGLISLTVMKKEARDRDFVQPLESLGRLVAMALQFQFDSAVNTLKERRLKAEVESTMRELEQTNTRLIDRVKELKLLYNELHKRVQELTAANHAKDEFLSIVSHELRTPLTSLTGFLCVLLEEEAGPVNEQQRKFLKITKQSADRLNVMISDLLDISRIEAGRLNLQMGTMELAEILQKSVEGLRKNADVKNVRLVFQPCPAPPPVWGDPSRLQQVIDNLISNAIKFTPPEGQITVGVEEKGDCIQVSVSDTGIGLSADEQKRVFDMFYQADASARRSKGGAGLGLAIAKGIITMHGGQIWVASEKDKGATFSFMIPRSKIQKAA